MAEGKPVPFEYFWNIKDFSKIDKENGQKMSSDEFSIYRKGEEIQCRLDLFPAGVKQSSKDSVSLFLWMKSENPQSATYHFSVIDCDGINRNTLSVLSYEFNDEGFGFPGFIKKSVLTNEAERYLPNDILTLKCSIILLSKDKGHRHCDMTASKLPAALNSLMLDKSSHDIRIIGPKKSKVFTAHKSVLSARSPVFERMLSAPMKESETKEISIDDIDEDVIEEMINFMYTNEVKDIESHFKDLAKAADKYDVTDLKFLCEENLALTISLGNVAELLELSHTYNMSGGLWGRCLSLIENNAPEVIETEGWKKMASRPENHVIINKVLTKVVMTHKHK